MHGKYAINPLTGLYIQYFKKQGTHVRHTYKEGDGGKKERERMHEIIRFLLPCKYAYLLR